MDISISVFIFFFSVFLDKEDFMSPLASFLLAYVTLWLAHDKVFIPASFTHNILLLSCNLAFNFHQAATRTPAAALPPARCKTNRAPPALFWCPAGDASRGFP